MANGIGVTIGSRSLRAVEVRRRGGIWQVTGLRAAPLGEEGEAEEARVAAARAALAGAGMKGTALLGLSGKDLIVRYTRVPRVPDWRLEMLMRFEIQEVAEQSGGDVAADWALLSLPAAAGEDDTVLVALARNAHLRPRLDALRAAGLSDLGGCPRSIALYHAFVTNAKVPPGEVTLLLHVAGENTDVAIQRDGALLFARNMAGGGRPFTDALAQAFHVAPGTAERMKVQKGSIVPRQKARYADSSEEKVANTLLGTAGSLVAAVHSSLMFCKAQTKLQDLRIDRVLLTGAGSRLRGMRDYLASGLGIPVEAYDPFEGVDCSGLDAEESEALKEEGPSMAVALGLAQMAADEKAFRLQILPEADRKRRDFARHTVWLLASGVVAAAGLVFLYAKASGQESEAKRNDAALTQAQQKAAQKREQGAQRQSRVEAAVRRLEALRDEVRLGPSLEQATGVVQEVLDSDAEFQAVHFPDMKARSVQMAVPKDLLPAPSEEAPPGGGGEKGEKGRKGAGGGDEDAVQARVPVLLLSGNIEALERKPADVFSNFTSALKAKVEGNREKGIPGRIPHARVLVERGLQNNRTFEAKIVFFEGWLPVTR